MTRNEKTNLINKSLYSAVSLFIDSSNLELFNAIKQENFEIDSDGYLTPKEYNRVMQQSAKSALLFMLSQNKI